MLGVYSVSDITKILSGTIQQKGVRVQGRVSLEDELPNAFFLSHEGKKIRCFVRDGISRLDPLLTAGDTVTVTGDISVYSPFSQYQIRVTDVQSGINTASTVSGITQRLSGIIEAAPQLAEIQVQGRISELTSSASYPGALFWDFWEADKQKLRCFSNLNNAISANNGDEVRIQGKIEIYGPNSQYQITVEQIEQINQFCQCPGCDRCGNAPSCDRPREVASFESCDRCLPRPSDELYELCQECYAINPNREIEVAEAVYAYFPCFCPMKASFHLCLKGV